MTKIEDINKEIKFDEKSHTYKDKDGNELISVSTLLNLFKPPFDPNGFVARACAKKEGISVQEILSRWEETKNLGLSRGKNFHRQIEHFIKTNEILDEDYKDVIEKIKNKIKFDGVLYCEIPISNLNYMIGGTVDLIQLFDDNVIEIADWKSNKKMEKISKYKKKLLPPLDKYDDANFNPYIFQLNLYRFILEQHGYKVRKLTLYHINPETRDVDSYPVPILKRETLKLLNHYKGLKSF